MSPTHSQTVDASRLSSDIYTVSVFDGAKRENHKTCCSIACRIDEGFEEAAQSYLDSLFYLPLITIKW